VDEDRPAVEDGGSDALSGRSKGDPIPDEKESGALPPVVRQRLDRCAEQWLLDRQCEDPDAAAGRGANHVGTDRRSRATWIPWLVAAVSVVLAVTGWWPRLMDGTAPAAVSSSFGQWRAASERAQMLAGSQDVGHWPWAGDGGQNNGDVVWDNLQQRGFLRLKGFVANDPSSARYQLWIFDASRDDRYPVDGGIFDVPPGRSEVLIPVTPSVPVLRPEAFAVTVEGPRGSVVSERAKVVAFARVDHWGVRRDGQDGRP
jgi:hypothetical protein